ncbi:hypothetical protein N0007_27700, partial [Pseudomonas aeruginosa]|nr:hypothetical protein [Pseudomonas aeruginosa]
SRTLSRIREAVGDPIMVRAGRKLVPDEEVRGYYAGGWRIEELERGDVLGVNWKFLERGVSWLDEAVYLLERG